MIQVVRETESSCDVLDNMGFQLCRCDHMLDGYHGNVEASSYEQKVDIAL